jgi:hypothetical protein
MRWLTKFKKSEVHPVKSVNGRSGNVGIEPLGHRPDRETMRVLALGFIPEVRMVCVEWLEWAIIYTDSDLPIPCQRYVPSLVEYFKYTRVLCKACKKYLEENK